MPPPFDRWKPSPAIKLSLLLGIMALLVPLWQPALWPWSLSFILTNRVILVIAGLLPRSSLLGNNITRLSSAATQRNEIAITIDDGPDPQVTPQVLDILDSYEAKATFFCIGRLAEQHPELCREIVRRGHLIENHTQSHSALFSLFLPHQIQRELGESQRTLTQITGQTPRLFRPTAGLRNPELDLLLPRHNLRLCSWTRRGLDTLPISPERVLSRLTHQLKAGDILLLHDGSPGRTRAGTPLILIVLPQLLEHMKLANLHPVTLRDALP